MTDPQIAKGNKECMKDQQTAKDNKVHMKNQQTAKDVKDQQVTKGSIKHLKDQQIDKLNKESIKDSNSSGSNQNKKSVEQNKAIKIHESVEQSEEMKINGSSVEQNEVIKMTESSAEQNETMKTNESSVDQNEVVKINESLVKQNKAEMNENSFIQNKATNINDDSKSPPRTFKICIEGNADIKQGQCTIQNSLDTWKSHLIGLEYIIEIQDKKEPKYYCVLCSEYIKVESVPAISVINHITGRKHIIMYLGKHFSSYGFKFDEKIQYNIPSLQRICEEINKKMGYYSICITNFNCFIRNTQQIKRTVQSAFHINEKSLELNKNAFQEAIDNEVLQNVEMVVNGIIRKVLASEKNAAAINKTSTSQSESVKKAVKSYKQKESIFKSNLKSSSFLKPKGNTNLSSYLKTKYAKAKYKGLKPLIGLSSINRKLSNENIDSREKNIEHTTSKEESGKSKEVSDIYSDASEKVVGNKEKVLQKSAVHSKHCRKRILGRETTRLKVTAKGSTKDEIVSSTFKKSKDKCVSAPKSENQSSSKKSVQGSKSSESVAVSSNNDSSIQKLASVPTEKGSKEVSKSPVTRSSKNTVHKVICKKSIENSAREKDMTKNKSSNWKPMTRSPVKSVDSSTYLLKSETRKHSESPLVTSSIKRTVRMKSKSPRKVIKSPLRVIRRSPVRKLSRSPVRRLSRSPLRRKSRSPVRRKSRSPFWKHSRSPLRKRSRSPVKKRSKSPIRKHSKSPIRRHSRSPTRKHSRSPLRKNSRSPVRRYSRSPLRRYSRSFRRRSRSPIRRYSRSPKRRNSRSPLRKRSRSPMRRQSRSPYRRRSRSPLRKHSRSPIRRNSGSPVRRHSRSPVRRHSRSPVGRYSRSPIKRPESPIRKHSRSSVSLSDSSKEFNMYKVLSPNIGHSGSGQDHIISKDRFPQNVYNYGEHLGKHDREFKVKSSKPFHPVSVNLSDKHKSHTFAPSTVRGISDLDPVSDEDESIYFDKQHVEDSISSLSTNKMFEQFLQKLSVPNVTPTDPNLNKWALFMEAHKEELKELIGSQSTSKAGIISANIVDPNVQERNLFLQQFLLSNLAGSNQEPAHSSLALNKKSAFQQPPFLPVTDNVRHGLVHNIPPHNHPQSNLPRFFPPNVNVPPPTPYQPTPPNPYQPFNQPRQEFPSQAQVPPEVMFKDLKATVNKLFGANESAAKQEKHKPLVPEYVTQPDPEKWDLNHPDILKFNTPAKFSSHIIPRFSTPINQKDVFHSQGKPDNFSNTPGGSVMRADISIPYDSGNSHGQFFSSRGIARSQGPNVTIPPPDAKVSFCDVPRGSSKGNLFPVVHNVNSSFSSPSPHANISDVKVSLAQRLASVLVKFGMTDVPAPLLQEMLMKIGAFSSLPRQDICEDEIISILKRLGYLF